MFHSRWPVLVVDDAPDVLQITRLLLKRTRILGLPVEVHTAASAAEAEAWLLANPALARALPVALLDVVMETDDAGLRLCGRMRELGLDTCHVVIRTGQPGLAPAREVIDRHAVDNYISKVECTEGRLYSLLKTGVEQHLVGWWARAALRHLAGADPALDEAFSGPADSPLHAPRLELRVEGRPTLALGELPEEGVERFAAGAAELRLAPSYPLPPGLRGVVQGWVDALGARP